MAHYIDKDALVAEIDERIKAWKEYYDDMRNAECHELASGVYLRIDELENLKKFLDTLEVKEVNLEGLVKDFCYEYDNRKEKWYELCPNDRKLLHNPTWANFAMSIAKHFFELGVKVKQG